VRTYSAELCISLHDMFRSPVEPRRLTHNKISASRHRFATRGGLRSRKYGGFLAQVKKGNCSTWKAVLGREADSYLASSGDNRGRELYRTLETTIDYSLVRVRLLG
jgi:hypothetical protein